MPIMALSGLSRGEIKAVLSVGFVSCGKDHLDDWILHNFRSLLATFVR